MALSKLKPNSFDDIVEGNPSLIINGDFAVSQRGTSFTADNVYTIDRWKSGDGTGGSPARTLSQEEFSLGQTDVPNARYYLKHNQTGASTNGNASLSHRIENVTRFDGETVTLSFYAKADATMDIDIRFIQDFGTGGSPSSDITLTETVSIGTSWTKYIVTKTLGSISGKTVGTDGEHTSFLNIDIEFQPTSTFTFEAALFKLEYGDTATPFQHLSYAENLQQCQRYFQSIEADNQFFVGRLISSDRADFQVYYHQRMRTEPAFETNATGCAALYDSSETNLTGTFSFPTKTEDMGFIRMTAAQNIPHIRNCTIQMGSGAVMEFDAEL